MFSNTNVFVHFKGKKHVSTTLPIRQPIEGIVSQDEYFLKPYNNQYPAQLGAEIIRRRLDNNLEFKMFRHRLLIQYFHYLNYCLR